MIATTCRGPCAPIEAVPLPEPPPVWAGGVVTSAQTAQTTKPSTHREREVRPATDRLGRRLDQ